MKYSDKVWFPCDRYLLISSLTTLIYFKLRRNQHSIRPSSPMDKQRVWRDSERQIGLNSSFHENSDYRGSLSKGGDEDLWNSENH